VGAGSLALVDWRRRVGELYAHVRATPDPRDAHAAWRAGRDDLLRRHPESPVPAPARAAYPGPSVAPYDPDLRFEVEVEPAAEAGGADGAGVGPSRFEAATGTDGTVAFERMGAVHLDGLGSLDVWWLTGYGGGLFVPVRDALAGTETYGGGRYVLDTVKGADLGGGGGRLVIDLNFAYNPSCAYDPAWACPLAPAGNVLAAPVRAGELQPT
jgi:hypothetical protein